MTYVNPEEGFNVLRDQTVDEIKKHFPLTGAKQSLHLEDVEFGHVPKADDIKAQHQAKISGDTWGVPVFGRVTLRDNATGKVLDRRKVKLVDLPKMTRGRYSYIVGGQEYQLENQWQLNPGVYTRRRQNGELESRFNLAGRGSFDIVFHPDKKQFVFNWGKSNLPLYPILHAAGMTDPELERAWGKDILEANKDVRGAAGVLMKFYKSEVGEAPPSHEAAVEHLRTLLFNSKLRPDMTKLTLGRPFEFASGEAMTAATKRLLSVHDGQPEDDRDSLIFKSLRSAGEFAADHIRQAIPRIRTKVQRTIDSATNVREAFKTEFFNEPVRAMFRSSLARVPDQINPLEMVASSMQTTVMGPGGIQSAHKVMESSKLINQSHFGFIDPLHTPEGEKTGITLRLPLGVRKNGSEAQLRAYNTKTKKLEWINPATFLQSNVVLPDQVSWKPDGTPKALYPSVSTMGVGNHISKKPISEADYVLPQATQLWDIGSNLIPMLPSVSGPRASMAGRHMEQAISLVHREPPLVQVKTGVGNTTFEEVLGNVASHQSPVDGTVHQVRRDSIIIKDKDGTAHDVPLYDHYPLNDPRAMITSIPLVKAGDTVKSKQTIADTNFSKNGVMALGTNMRVAYIPYKGLNFEDGVVISESAAKKFTSNHLYKPSLRTDDTVILDKRKFNIHHPGVYTKEQLSTIGDDGVVHVGTIVKPGDPLVVALRPLAVQDKTSLAHIHKSLAAHHSNASVAWDSEHPGEVIATHRKGKDIVVHVRTAESMQVGDKIAGRSANKGVVTRIIPDHEMPHDEHGKPVDVLLNPFGVPGRMNPAQLFETAASKIALKMGKPYAVRNFDPGVNYLDKIKSDLAAHGIKDTEKLIDPLTKLPLGEVLVGHQYLHKLVHQVEKKVSVRSGMGLPGQPAKEHYDSNMQPVGGGHQGGQSIGSLGYYALLAHGAKANIREMNTWKSEGTPTEDVNVKGGHVSQHAEVWGAIQRGTPLPTPQPTFAFKKFESYLRGAGINMEKKGHNFVLSPLTDQQILRLSAGAIPDPIKVVRAKDVKELKGGLFDEKLTGGFGGTKWSHIALAEPLPNPTFEEPICSLLHLKGNEFDAIVAGTKGLSAAGHVVEPHQGLTGGTAIEAALKKIDVQAELKKTLALLSASSNKSAKINDFLKRAKYLRALDQLKIGAADAYVLHHLPVLPPAMRPVTVLPSGDIRYDDINGLYVQFAMLNEQLAKPGLKLKAPPQFRVDLRKSLYDGVKALMGVGIPYDRADQKGLLHTIQGIQPKKGFFQKTLMSRRQDLTARSVIVPEPALGLDEVGIPRDVAVKLFRPFIVNKLVNTGMAPIVAQEHLAKNGELVNHALNEVIAERPVLMKRDPALHKYNVQGFKPRIVNGTAIQVHPLICGSYNADFDGDMVSLYVPIAHDAVQEAKKMMPSANLFNEATGKVMYQPTKESLLGVYRLTIPGQKTSHTFSSHDAVTEAFKNGQLKYSDVVKVGGTETTPGRVLVANTLPTAMRPYLLGSMDNVLTSDKLSHVMTTLARDHAPDFGTVANKLKDLGNGAAFGVIPQTLIGKDVPIGAHTLSLSDFTPDNKTRATVVMAAQAKVDAINKSSLREPEKERRAVEVWKAADAEMKKLHKSHMDSNPSNLTLMATSGDKPGWTQYKQLVLAPMTFQDSLGRDIPIPVTKNYSEGLDLGGYWTQMYGARRGTVMKVQEVQRPGYLTKLMMNSSMHMVVAEPDCGTDKGIALPVVDKHGRNTTDVHDRFLAQPFKANGLEIPAGTVLTPSLVDRIRAAKKDATLVVRSPLKCEHSHGFCQKCLGLTTSGGLTPIGTNAGVVAAQTLGERAVQLSMRVFHTGGAAGGGGTLVGGLTKLEQLTNLPKTLPDATPLAMRSGTIDNISVDRTGATIHVDGKPHHVGRDHAGNLLHHPLPGAPVEGWEPPKVGMKVTAGQPLGDPSRTVMNPHALLEATGRMDVVQGHLANELHQLFKDEGVRRLQSEIVVKAMGNLTKVTNPGDHPTILRGEFHPTSVVNHINATQLKGKRPIQHEPTLQGVSMLPLSVQEDWMAKLQHNHISATILDAAATHGSSSIHGTHPVPGSAYAVEFGLTSTDSKKPQYSHLKDVPTHHY